MRTTFRSDRSGRSRSLAHPKVCASTRRRQRKPLLESLDSRVMLSGVQATYAVTQDWGSGFQAQISLMNSNPTSVPNWKLEFDYSLTIGSIWDAQVASHVGSHYVVTGAGWNNTLPGNGSVSFGFVGNPGGSTAKPTNYMLNGVSLGGPSVPALTIGDVPVVEGNSGTTNAVFSVSLSQASSTPVTVQYTTADGTATLANNDYVAAAGTLTFAPGVTTQTFSVKVVGDTQVEPDETFAVKLSNPVGATLSRAQATGTIKNDDTAPPTGNIQFQVTSDWGSGFTGQITMRNGGTTPLTNWVLEFDFPATVTSIWNASVASHVGNQYVIQAVAWNSTIAAGASTSFGFNASPGGGTAVPTNYNLHSGGSTGGGGLVAGNDAAATYAGLPVAINVLANDNDPDGDWLTVASVTQGANGTVVANADRTVTYTPRAGFTGADTFHYTVTDGAGSTATASVSVTVSPAPAAPVWPSRVFAPYVDMGLYPTFDLASATRNYGVKFFTLAFIVADSAQHPAWGGYTAYEINGSAFDVQARSQVATVRSLGGDVMVSFGGAAGQELAQVITDPTALKNAYQTVVSAYGLTHIDFDIEGAAVADHASIDRRSQALAALQHDATASGKPLAVWFTLPVLPTGLTPDGLYVLQSALRYGVRIGGVNVMAMDYGESAAPNPAGHMGEYAIQAANSLFGQLQGLYGTSLTSSQLWSMIGITPMIGLNDDTHEVFDQAAAQQVASFGVQKGLGRISMWSLNRDRQSPNGALTYVETTSSSILQQPDEFSKIFETYMG